MWNRSPDMLTKISDLRLECGPVVTADTDPFLRDLRQTILEQRESAQRDRNIPKRFSPKPASNKVNRKLTERLFKPVPRFDIPKFTRALHEKPACTRPPTDDFPWQRPIPRPRLEANLDENFDMTLRRRPGGN